MTRVLHVIDASVDESQLQVLNLLVTRQRERDATPEVCCVDAAAGRVARSLCDVDVMMAPQRMALGFHWSPSLKRHDSRLIHAWGADAARMAGTSLRGVPLVISLHDPRHAANAARCVLSLRPHATIITSTQVARLRLIARGVDPSRIVVIRTGVDFGLINAARQRRASSTSRVDGEIRLLFTGPPTREGGQYHGLWAAAIVAQIHRGLRVMLPYRGQEKQRLVRFMRQIGMSKLLVPVDDRLTWPELLSAADFFVAPAVDEIATAPIAWAMAARVPIVATAVRSIAELLADRHNAFLCKPHDPRALAARILTALEDRETCRRVTETASGQAYELFGVRDFVDNHARLYENVLSGSLVREGVVDTAVATG